MRYCARCPDYINRSGSGQLISDIQYPHYERILFLAFWHLSFFLRENASLLGLPSCMRYLQLYPFILSNKNVELSNSYAFI